MPVFLGLIAAAAVIVLVIKIRRKRKKTAGAAPMPPHWAGRKNNTTVTSAQFMQKGKELGLVPAECTRLMELAAAEGLKPPTQFFWVPAQMDIVLQALVLSLRITGKEDEDASQILLGKLLEYRKQMSLKKINIRRGLKSTKEISAGQEVQVILNGVGIFATKVCANGEYLQVLSPIIADLPPNFTWINQKIIVFFRRKDDGEYSFSTVAAGEQEDGRHGEMALSLRHANTLTRSQKRRSIRTVIRKEGHIYPADNAAEFAESTPCEINDISDNGCSIFVQGRLIHLNNVVIQFTLNKQLVSLHGTCKRVLFNRQQGVSLLHIEFAPLPLRLKNQVLGCIFGVFPDESTGAAHSSFLDADGAPNRLTDVNPDDFSWTEEMAAAEDNNSPPVSPSLEGGATKNVSAARAAAEKEENPFEDPSLIDISFDIFKENP